jgi:hypothetical protein
MTIRTKLAATLLAAFLAAGAAQARDQLGDTDAVAVDPHKSYIFFRSDSKAHLRFLREVTPAQHDAWKSERDAAYAKARARYVKRFAQWRASEKLWQATDPAGRANMVRVDKPELVTEQTFAFPVPELSNFVEINPGREFSKEADGRTYFIAVEPGAYSVYGSVIVTENGAVGTCLCMGSVRFEAKPGRIADLGRFADPEGDSTHLLVPATAAMTRPARLAGLPVAEADLHASGKVPNYFGVAIDRLPAIAGVLSYRRDIPVDVKTSTDAEPVGER